MVKVISLSDNAYEKLKALKGGKSFSETIIEVIDKRKSGSIMEFYGAFSNYSNEWNEIKEKLHNNRKNFKLKEAKFNVLP